MMKALVTGGGGFVGQAVVKMLVERGDEVGIIGRGAYPALSALGVAQFRGDIRDQDFLLKSCRGYDTIIHVAAKAGIWGKKNDYETVNVGGTENILKACRKNFIPSLVYTSTPSVVFNGHDIKGGDESLPLATSFLCHYAATKAKAERMVLAANSSRLKTCALRPHLIWGPGDPHLIPRLLDRGRRRMLRQVGDGDNLVDISYIDNVAHAHLLAADNLNSTASAAGNAYFISQGKPINLWSWINDLFQRFAIPSVQGKIRFRSAYRLGSLLESVYRFMNINAEPRMTRFLAEQLAKSHWFSIARAQNDLGYQPIISTEEGEQRLVSFYNT
jgi:nucleoside-diphosphate-sugar epimerase